MSKLVYRHDRAGYTGELRFSITSDAEYGAIGEQGIGAARNLPDGVIDAEGYAKASGGGDYVMAGAVPGVNILPARHRLTVRRGSTPVASVSFEPVETASGVIDVLQLVQSGGALALTPAQLSDFSDVLTQARDSIPAALEEVERRAQVVSGLRATAVDATDPETGLRVSGLAIGQGDTVLLTTTADIDPETGLAVTGYRIGGLA